MKQTFYFLFLLALPLRIPYTPLVFLAACILSIFEKKQAYQATNNVMLRIFTDEEPMNMALLLLILFSPFLVKMLIYACLMMWAFLMWCEWAYEMLEASKKPGGQPIYGLPAMLPVIEIGMIFRVEILKTKTYIEIFLALLSTYMLFIGRIAPIFPIFFW